MFTNSIFQVWCKCIFRLLLIGAISLFSNQILAQCGGEGQRPCNVWERVPSCNDGLVEKNGKCVLNTPCGGEGQRPCKVWERVPSCNSGLMEKNGKCALNTPCGGEGQRPCKVWERVPSCNSGLVEKNGKCALNTPCGGEGQRPCKVWERVPSCNSGLVENFNSGTCVHARLYVPGVDLTAQQIRNLAYSTINDIMDDIERTFHLVEHKLSLELSPELARQDILSENSILLINGSQVGGGGFGGGVVDHSRTSENFRRQVFEAKINEAIIPPRRSVDPGPKTFWASSIGWVLDGSVIIGLTGEIGSVLNAPDHGMTYGRLAGVELSLQSGTFTSANQCHNKCAGNEDCRGWEYNMRTNKCYFTTEQPTGYDETSTGIVSKTYNLDVENDDDKKRKAYISGGWTLGTSAGIDTGPVFSRWTVPMDDFPGDSWGIGFAAGAIVGGSVILWYGHDKIPNTNVHPFLGYSIGFQIGASLELEVIIGVSTSWMRE